ncbi:hypothetical protein FOZ62_017081, partial [Perkinsus olseni]
ANAADEALGAAGLEYRPWQAGDVIDKIIPYEPSVALDRVFVAVNSKGVRKNVVGGVASELEFPDRMQGREYAKFAAVFPHAAIVRISYVWVHVDWRSKRVASTMFPKALEDV